MVLGDMATTFVPGRFTLVYLVWNGLSYLRTQDEQVRCFANAARHLVPGGRFVVELWVPGIRRPDGPAGRSRTGAANRGLGGRGFHLQQREPRFSLAKACRSRTGERAVLVPRVFATMIADRDLPAGHEDGASVSRLPTRGCPSR